MLRRLLLYLSDREVPKKLLTSASFGRRLARRFIAGEDLEDAVRAVRQLNAEGFDVTLDCLGESVKAVSEAEEACRTYLTILDRIAAEKLRSHISVKLTQLGLALDPGLTLRLLNALWQRAAERQTFVRVDMESSAYVEETLSIFREANAPRDALGIVIQSCLYRSEKDVEDLIRMGARVRLVKGAYQEPPSVAFPDKADVDASFISLMKMLLSSDSYHAIATHDPHIIAATEAFAREKGLGLDRFEFQMLYGIRRHSQRDLVRRGCRVRVYVPYGTHWYPYFMRRLAERPANLLFLLRNLFRG